MPTPHDLESSSEPATETATGSTHGPEPAGPDLPILPAGLAPLVAGARWTSIGTGASTATVWQGVLADGAVVFLKSAGPVGVGDGSALLRDECDRLAWFAGRLPVPEVLGWAQDDHTGEAFLLTRALPGTPGSNDEHRGDAEALIRAFAAGLRAVHELPVAGCPFGGRLDHRITEARERVEAGLVRADDFELPYQRYTPERLLELLESSRPSADEDLVVVHGDYSLPNVLFDSGTVVGYLDVGRAGVADRYVDLAVAAVDLAGQVSPHALGPFFDAYGIDLPDVVKLDFYVLLDEFF